MIDQKIDTLLVVAECKNFTKAAEILSLTQPAVSHHISQLEEECNAKLFVRGKGDVKLTQEGKIAVTYARRLKALYQKMLSKIADEQTHATKIRIGITHTSENNRITEVLAEYVNQNSNRTITIITDTINNLYDMLENYELDIAIVEGQKKSPNLEYIMLDTDCLMCILSNDNPLAKQSTVSIADLKKQNMILRLPSSSTRQLFEATLISCNESIKNFNIGLEVDNVATIKELVKHNLGVSVLPRSACMHDVKKNRLTMLPIKNLSMMREMNIAYNKDFVYLEALKDIVKIYQNQNIDL